MNDCILDNGARNNDADIVADNDDKVIVAGVEDNE